MLGGGGRSYPWCILCGKDSQELGTPKRAWSLRTHLVEAHGLDLFPACSLCLEEGQGYCRYRQTDVTSHIARRHDMSAEMAMVWMLVLTRDEEPSKFHPAAAHLALLPAKGGEAGENVRSLVQRAKDWRERRATGSISGPEPSQEPSTSRGPQPTFRPKTEWRKFYQEKRRRSRSSAPAPALATSEEEESDAGETLSDRGAQAQAQSPVRAHTSPSRGRPAERTAQRKSTRRTLARTAESSSSPEPSGSTSWEEAPLPEHQSALLPEVATLLGVPLSEATRFQRMLNHLHESRAGGAQGYLWDCRLAPHRDESVRRGTKGPGAKKSGKKT